ncbi:helix-turn-helix domain-containing protein [Streptomyces sp. NPDC060064]|uniref:helix-turn-helix domain-containing protein n=1 Tax=Streptomyces sp. NPDC060064 TaxID=3347049 RepID=UPI00368928F3
MTLDVTTRATKPRLTEETTRYARIVGRNIALRRTRRGLSQEQLVAAMTAADLPVTATVIGFIEAGRVGRRPENQYRNVSVDQLMAFATFFGCDPTALLTPACEACEGFPPAGFTCKARGTAEAAGA